MDLFEELKQSEENMTNLEELKKCELELFNERLKLFLLNRERYSEPVRVLMNKGKEDFKEYFLKYDNFSLSKSNEDITVIESKKVIVTLEKTDGEHYAFSLVYKNTDEYIKNKYYVINVAEEDETIYNCKFLGYLEEGIIKYPGSQRGDTIETVKEQIEKLKTDIREISNNQNEPVLMYKLYDSKYSYLDEEFDEIIDLFNRVLR